MLFRSLERRVVQHVPSSMGGLKVEDNTRGVVEHTGETPMVSLQQAGKTSEVNRNKLLGLHDEPSKLKKQNGVRVISQNYGVALIENPVVIPWHKVFPRLRALKGSLGRSPEVVRNGMLISVRGGTYEGIWRVMSVKDNSSGLALDIAETDGVASYKVNARLRSMLCSGLRILHPRLTGIDQCHTTSSTSGAQTSV